MSRRTLRRVFVFFVLLDLVFSAVPLAKKTKLCGDESCKEALFKGKFRRTVATSFGDSFLTPTIDDEVVVNAFKFSDRTDLMEGALLKEPLKKGNFYSAHINLDGYVEFLRQAIISNKTLYVVSLDPNDPPARRLLGTKSALPELIKDYEVHSTNIARENSLPPPEPIDYAALGYFPEVAGHGHSHGGHGHSHEGHGHSHEGHGHSHEGHGHSHEGHGHSHEAHGHSHEEPGHPEVKVGQPSGVEAQAQPQASQSSQGLPSEAAVPSESEIVAAASPNAAPAATSLNMKQAPVTATPPPLAGSIVNEAVSAIPADPVPPLASSTPHAPFQEDAREVRTDIVEDDGLGYCIKGDCDRVYRDAPNGTLRSSAPRSVVGRWLSKVIGLFRYALPAPIADIDDAGVVVTFLVPVCVIIHLVRVFFFSDSSEQEALDRRSLHDTLTAVRERDELIKLLRVEADKGKALANRGLETKIEQLKDDIAQGILEIQQLKTRCSVLEDESERFKLEAADARTLAESERQKLAKMSEEKKQLERTNLMLSDQVTEMQSTMENAREKSEGLEEEMTEKNSLIARLEKEAKIHVIEIKKLTDQLKTSQEEGRVLSKRVEALQNESVQLTEMIDEINKSHSPKEGVSDPKQHDEHAAQESGGSAGWSDIGDFDIDASVTDDKKAAVASLDSSASKAHPSSDIMEVARLRAQLKRVESDLSQARLTLQKEENTREHLLRKVELAEGEASERRKETDAKEAERIDTHSQCKKLLGMIEERDAKVKRAEETTERLRDEVDKWQTEVRHLEEQKKALESKLNDTEQELKRLRVESNRLETRYFHEVRDARQTITALQQSMGAAQMPSMPSAHNDSANLMNFSGNSSSDRDFGGASLAPQLGSPPLSLVRPLWGDDDPPEMYSMGEAALGAAAASLRGRTTSPEEVNAATAKKVSRSRRSQHRDHNDPPAPDGTLPRPKKEARRVRSRSHGRHPMTMGYGPSFGLPAGYYQAAAVPPPFADMFSRETPLNRHASRSGNLYYSSGGSNGGLSPPPELALLSGVPPADLPLNRPTASTRPKSVAEQTARHHRS